MTCQTFERQLQDLADNQLNSEQLAAATAHLRQCEHCHQALAEHREYLQMMQNFETPEPAPGRLAHMLRQARGQGETQLARSKPRFEFIKGFATAAALAVIAVAGQWQYREIISADPSPPADRMIAEYAVSRQVTVVINVPADMPATMLVLDFPAPLRMEGLEDLQQVNWRVDLEQGSNVLTLPVKVAAGTNLAENLSIKATVDYENKRKEFELPVQLLATRTPGHGSLLTPVDQSILHI